MLYSIKNRNDLENLNKLISLQRQVKALRLQDQLGKQNSHKNMKESFQTVTETIKDICEDVTRSMTETSIQNNKEQENLTTNSYE